MKKILRSFVKRLNPKQVASLVFKNKRFLILLLILPFIINMPVQAQERPNLPEAKIEARPIDQRAEVLQAYLAQYNSPMQYQAHSFVEAADTYNLDWKLLPAIAGVESTFGKHIPGGFNAWGWGVYGTQAIYFSSWRDGIFTLAKGLREGYLNKGLNDPYSMNRIYAASPSWGTKVSYFMQDLQNFADKFETDTAQVSQIGKDPNVAAVSGKLALR